jgi:ribosome-binding protein aMBF1 (putative translation factor)
MLENPTVHVSASTDGLDSPLQQGTPEINLRFGARLRNLRTKRNLSQEELAIRISVPVSHLIDIEAGHKSATILDLDSFARQLNLSIAELLLGL